MNSHIQSMIKQGSNRRNHFNFLRLLFACLVILAHAFELIDGNTHEPLTRVFGTLSFGEFAVDGFFLLSGYLIVQSWDARPQVYPYLAKRILRIYSGFLLATLVCVLIAGPFGSNPHTYFPLLNIKTLILSYLKLLSPPTPPVFLGQPFPIINDPMWTIHTEFICYLLVLIFGFAGLPRRKTFWLTTAGLLFAIMLWHNLGHQLPLRGRTDVFDAPIFRLALFFFVGGSYYLFRDRVRYRPWMACLAGAILIACMFRSSVAELASAICGGYLLFYFAFASIPFLAPFQSISDVSYGLYLYG